MQLRYVLFVTIVPFLLVPELGRSQTSIINRNVQISPAYNVAFEHPQPADGGVINCVYPTPGCAPFNRAACSGQGLPINLVVTRNTAAVGVPGRYTYAWVQPNNGACVYSSTTCTTDPNNSQGCRAIGSGQSSIPLQPVANLAGGPGVGLRIPDDFSTTLTTTSLLQLFPNVCDPNQGVQFTLFEICFGVDNNGTSGINDASGIGIGGGQDPSGFFQFPVDTVPPPAPTNLSTKSFVQDVDVTVSYDTSSNDVKEVHILSTSDPNNLLLHDCSQWTGNIRNTGTDVSGDPSGSTTVSVPGSNGVVYGYCAVAVDYVGNVSTPSNSAQDSPHPECDFFGCYPDDLRVGYCGAALTPAWFGVIGAAWAASRLRRWRRR